MTMGKKTRKKPDRKWRDPTTDAGSNSLEIIGAVAGAALQPRWSQSEANSFVRLALGVAVRDAKKFQGHRSRDQFEYWQQTADISGWAASALQRLIEHASPEGLQYGIRFDSCGYNSYSVMHLRKLPGDKTASPTTSKAELDLLCEAHKAIKAINRSAREYEKRLSRSTGNEREQDKHAFTLRLAEAWIYLTGKLPGLGTERNPFLRFVEAAAQDAGIWGVDFRSATMAAVKTLKGGESLAKKGGHDPLKNRGSISFLRVNGPSWLRAA
jgi:hypothetical protein